MFPDVMDVIDSVKARFVEAANRNEPERVMPDVATLMTGEGVTGDLMDMPLQFVIYGHGLHEAAKVARQHGELRQADTYHELGQLLLNMAAESVGALMAINAHLSAVKH